MHMSFLMRIDITFHILICRLCVKMLLSSCSILSKASTAAAGLHREIQQLHERLKSQNQFSISRLEKYLFPDLNKYIPIFNKEKGPTSIFEKISIRIWRNPRQKDCSLSLILQTLFSSPELLDRVRVSSHLLLLLHITKSSFIIQFIYLFVNVKLLSIYSLHSFCNSSLPKLCPRQMCISHVSHFLPLLDLQFCCHDL